MFLSVWQTSKDITELIYDAYSKYSDITNVQIDKLRLKYRLNVVQVCRT